MIIKSGMIKPSIIAIFFAIILITSCVNHDLDGPVVISCSDTRTVSFNADIKPIISAKCAFSGCHNGDLGSDLNWNVLQNFQNHSAEVKRRITLPPSDSDKMPRVGKLNYDQIKLIVCWVEQGAHDN